MIARSPSIAFPPLQKSVGGGYYQCVKFIFRLGVDLGGPQISDTLGDKLFGIFVSG